MVVFYCYVVWCGVGVGGGYVGVVVVVVVGNFGGYFYDFGRSVLFFVFVEEDMMNLDVLFFIDYLCFGYG